MHIILHEHYNFVLLKHLYIIMDKVIEKLLLNGQTTPQAALEVFDSLETVPMSFMWGRWKGMEIPSGHPIDGILEWSNWYGKQFIDAENVHPLLIWTANKKGLYAINPRNIPLGMPFPKNKLLTISMRLLKPFLQTRQSAARLRMVEYRGKTSAAMVYDTKAIIDCFRKIDDRTVMGVMDLKGSAQPYFFALERDDNAAYNLQF